MAIVWQSVIFDEATVQVSYYDEDDRTPHGLLIKTAVINPYDLKAEVDEVFDSLTQLVAAWASASREVKAPRR